MSLHHFSFPTAITFGPGARRKVASHLATAGVKRPLIVTDRDLARLPFVAEFAGELQGSGSKPLVFSGVWGNPSGGQVTAGAAAFHDHHADGTRAQFSSTRGIILNAVPSPTPCPTW